MFKKPSIVKSYNTLSSSLQPLRPQSKTSLHLVRQQCRSYPMVSNGRSSHDHGSLRWPEMTSADTIPTPYQIFNQKKGSPYSKQRFYELVKLYHPDRHDLTSTTEGLSHASKLERYRLVVAANELLSDDVKRSAFDLYGAGWNGMPSVKSPKDHCNSSEAAWADRSGAAWDAPGGPSQNATWEDWERWYARHDVDEKQTPEFANNGAFLGIIVLLVVVGAVGNFSRGLIDQRDALHAKISKDLNRRRSETTSMFGSREERINSFLRQREPIGYEDITYHKDGVTRFFPSPEPHSDRQVEKRPMDLSKHFNNSKDG